LTKVSIIIAIYNEAATISELLRQVSTQAVLGLEKELVIIESNSSDNTRQLVQDFAARHVSDSPPNHTTIKLILQKQAKGKGNAVREGLAAATGDIILIQDGDLEYDVGDYPALLEPLLLGKADLVLGSRHLGAGSWKIRRFERNHCKAILLNLGGIFFHSLFNIIYKQRITDPTTMFKVFRRECLTGLHLEANRFDFDFELLGKLLMKGYTPYEVPISYSSRGFSEGKKVQIIRDPWTWLVAIVRYRFSSVGSSAKEKAPH
jgi:glycosyltransferase involved in cell wall biosynthesis